MLVAVREDERDGGSRETGSLLPFSMEDIAAAISLGEEGGGVAR